MKRVLLAAAAAAVLAGGFTATRVTDNSSRPVAAHRYADALTAGTSSVTVGQTLSATDMQVPITRPVDAAAQPTDWGSRVTMKGCGQTVSDTVHVGRRLLVVNGGSVPRFTLSSPLPQLAGAWVPRDWREYTFGAAGRYTLTWKTSTCTLPGPKLSVTVLP